MKNEILTLTKKAIRIQSTADNTAALEAVLSLFLDVFKNNPNVTIQTFRSNNLQSAIIFTKNKKPRIWLNAHLDVVTGNTSLFQPKIKKVKLFARGALDMKLAAACFTIITEKLIRNGLNVGLILVTDEEIGGHNGTKFLLDNDFVAPEFVVVGEPTNLEIGTESKGIISIDIISHGISAHGSRPWLGKNAILDMLEPLQQLQRVFPVPSKECWKTTVNVGVIQAGVAINQVPDVCTIKLDIRFIPQDNPKKIINRIKTIFKHQDIVIKMIEPPIFSNNNNLFIQNFFTIAKHVLKRKPIFRKGHGSSDIRFFTQNNIPAIAFGLKGKGLHAESEWVSLKEIEIFVKIIKTFLIQNCI